MKFAAWVHAGVWKAVLNRGVSTHPARIHFCSILFSNAKGILLLFLSSFFSSLFISFFFFLAVNPAFLDGPGAWVNVIDFYRVCHPGRPFRSGFVTEAQRRVEPSFSTALFIVRLICAEGSRSGQKEPFTGQKSRLLSHQPQAWAKKQKRLGEMCYYALEI